MPTLDLTAELSVGLVQTLRARLIENMELALTVKAVRDGAVSALTLSGELDLCAASELLIQAAAIIDNQTERLVLNLGALTFLDCAGARALAMAVSFAPAGCPVIIRSLAPNARRVLDLLALDLETLRDRAPTKNPATGRQQERSSRIRRS